MQTVTREQVHDFLNARAGCRAVREIRGDGRRIATPVVLLDPDGIATRLCDEAVELTLDGEVITAVGSNGRNVAFLF